jgi:tRNA pseudouridine38-40 synthase
MNYKLTIAYDGMSYSGFQCQIGKDTIEERIKIALKTMTKIDIDIVVAGRTDKGVHAFGQVINFLTTLDIEPNLWKIGLNKRLPLDIRVLNVSRVDESFHARHSAILKTYHYYIAKKESSVFSSRYEYYVSNFDVSKVNECIHLLEGTHDFLGFCKKVTEKDTIKTINKIEIIETDDHYIFAFYGKSFLRHMIRIIMGLVISIGIGLKNEDTINEVFLTNNRMLTGVSAPPSGLYLVEVKY